jgi:hypothetical protein
METMNREQWLNEIARRNIWPHLNNQGAQTPALWRVSLGFPKGSRGGKHAIGQCWKQECSGTQHREMFISPILDAGGPAGAVATLVHECIHAALNNEDGHKGEFKRIAKSAGLEGKMTATLAGESLLRSIGEWLAGMPAYPHSPLSLISDKPKPGSRLIKAECPTCGYNVRITRKWIDIGVPRCPNPECEESETSLEIPA